VFDAVKINEEELAQLYNFDLGYRIYFRDDDATFQPYLVLGPGFALAHTNEAGASNTYGGHLNAGLGFDIKLASIFYLGLYGRHNFVMTNKQAELPVTAAQAAVEQQAGAPVDTTAQVQDLLTTLHYITAGASITLAF